MKGEKGKATDFSIAAIMAPRGPSFGHYHLQGLGGNASANTSVECGSKAFVATSTLDHRELLSPGIVSFMFCWFHVLNKWRKGPLRFILWDLLLMISFR